MGLEGVEILMTVEERFGVRIPNSEAGRVRTVADLAALVWTLLPEGRETCPTARGFYRVRTLLVEHAGATRRSVRPTTRLADVFATRRRRTWGTVRRVEPRWPGLAVAWWGLAVAAVWAALGVLMVPSVLVHLMARFSFGVGVLGLVFMGVVILGVLVWIVHATTREIPTPFRTVGDAARMLAWERGECEKGRGLARQRVLDEVRRVVAEELRLPMERVRAESEFRRDLGV